MEEDVGSDDMACKLALLLPIAAVLIGLLPPATFATSNHGFRATLTRVHPYPGNYSAVARHDGRRLASLSYAATGRARASTSSSYSRGLLQAQVENGAGAYHMTLSVGTPPLPFPAIVDTGSDLTWTQCAPCTAFFAQPTPLYDPAASSTFSTLPCTSPLCQALPSAFRRACNSTATGCAYDYRYTVGFTAGYLATDTLAVGDDAGAPFSFPGVAFGCSSANGGDMDGTSGVAGLGRGALSLVSQLGVGRFSYCLRSDADAGASPILFGALAANVTGGGGEAQAQFTPLLQNPVPDRRATYYYVNLTGITVGETELPVTSGTFGFTAAGDGGVIVDTGTTLTYLAEAGYAMVREAFVSQSQAAGLTTVSGEPYDFDLCFAAAGDVGTDVPRLVLRFAGGAEYDVPQPSYFDAVDEGGSVACLLVLPTRGVSVIGNVMQMDLHVLFDLDGGTFSFAPADCASL
ncbi:unnamed protein product [Urochloa decumbens]|uniref:Peptidase A1 domain-containing protein n=1 Tax=Urochloa decumbens TaxID=240449 RepID=A0ABC9FW54_9POAL